MAAAAPTMPISPMPREPIGLECSSVSSSQATSIAPMSALEDPGIGRGAVGGDLGRDRAGAQSAGEEPPGGGQVAPLGQQHVNDLAVLVDRPVEIGPPSGDLDV